MLPIFCQAVAQIRRADETGGQMPVMRVDIRLQRLQNTRTDFRPCKVKVQHQDTGCLRFADQTPGCGDILPMNGVDDLFPELAVQSDVILVVQGGGSVTEDPCGVCVIGVGHQVFIRSAGAVCAA